MGNQQCLFCGIIEENNNEKIIYQDEDIVIINDIKPAAKVHLLAIPKKHIKNINYVTNKELHLLKHLRDKSLEYLTSEYGANVEIKIGFHKPPFVMIPHLHMHCLVPPFNSVLGKHILFNTFFTDANSEIEKYEINEK
jgi:diadenosine tetraphosphate (Ap4A) HIT family hydrolase